MPHAQLSYSSDLEIDAAGVLARIEEVILSHDAGAGACKGRAYPAPIFHHTHILIEIALLAKPHRNAAFITALSDDLEKAIKAMILQPCYFSMDLTFGSQIYVTNRHEGAEG